MHIYIHIRSCEICVQGRFIGLFGWVICFGLDVLIKNNKLATLFNVGVFAQFLMCKALGSVSTAFRKSSVNSSVGIDLQNKKTRCGVSEVSGFLLRIRLLPERLPLVIKHVYRSGFEPAAIKEHLKSCIISIMSLSLSLRSVMSGLKAMRACYK